MRMELPKQLQGVFEAAMTARDGDGEAAGLDRLEDGWPYSLDELIDQGGMKRIFKSLDRRSGRWVARAEMIRPERDALRFLREARLTAQLEHPNIMPIYEIGLTPGGAPYFTMKLCDGRSLEDILKELRGGGDPAAFPLEKRLEIFIRVLDGVASAHQAGVIHLDLKPANIQVSLHGDVLVCDWGLARVLDEICEDPGLLEHSIDSEELRTLTSHGFIKGSPGYMSPEQAGGPQVPKDQRSDIFSLGAILHALLCFHPPFEGSAEEIIRATRAARILPLGRYRPGLTIPASLEAVCLKAMALDPAERYASVDQMRQEIDAYRHGFATEAEQASPLKLLLLAVRRHQVESLLLVTCLAVVAVSVQGHISKLRDKEAETRAALARAVASESRLQSEVERNRLLGRESAPRHLKKALDAELAYDFKTARDFANMAVDLDPELTQAWGTKGLMHFVNQEFSASAEAYRHFGGKHTYMEEWAREFAAYKPDKQAFLPADKWLDLYMRLKARNNYVADRLLHCFLHAQPSPPLPLRVSIVESVTRSWNPGSSFRCEFDGVELKIADRKNVSWLYALQGFPAKKLDLSGSQIEHLNSLRGMPLEELDLSRTRPHDLSPLAKLPLTRLNLSGCKILSLAPLQQLPLRELDLRNCRDLKLDQLAGCRYLRRVHLSRGQDFETVKNLLPGVEWLLQ
ncbi:MAG: hypothetical protein RL095_891 [Verrucomicrobiota bacterium]|jgi:serine/threonine protein kinase